MLEILEAEMKLKPCPFCKRKRITSEPLGSFGPVNADPIFKLWVVECKCGVQMIKKTESETIKAWNRRAR